MKRLTPDNHDESEHRKSELYVLHILSNMVEELSRELSSRGFITTYTLHTLIVNTKRVMQILESLPEEKRKLVIEMIKLWPKLENYKVAMAHYTGYLLVLSTYLLLFGAAMLGQYLSGSIWEVLELAIVASPFVFFGFIVVLGILYNMYMYVKARREFKRLEQQLKAMPT